MRVNTNRNHIGVHIDNEVKIVEISFEEPLGNGYREFILKNKMNGFRCANND